VRTRAAYAALALSAVVWAARLGPSDRWLATGLLAYVPPPALAVVALGAGVILRRAGAPRAVTASALALAAGAVVVTLVENRRVVSPRRTPPGGIAVLHWNVARNPGVVPGLRARDDVDVVALNEAEPLPRGARGPGWFHAKARTLLLAARRPIRETARWQGAGAHGLAVVVATDPPLSLFLVDVAAQPWRPRYAALISLAEALDRFRPDLVLGDLNTPAHAASYARLLAGGYRDVYGDAGTGLGYTWPAFAPVLRLDHLLVRPGVAVLAHRSGASWRSDHRWQRVVVAPPR
jgi:vancomycin resistance protein VanJ